MEIKRLQSSAIQQNVTEQNSSLTPSASASIQKGIASAKDAFEVVQQNPTQAAPNSTSLQLPAVQKQISEYMSGQDNTGSLFSMMMEYQKMMNKEAREDRISARQSASLELETKSSQLDRQNEAIDRGMQEAGKKADVAMNEASLEYMIGTAGKLTSGDTKKDIDTMGKMLNELKKMKEKLLSEPDSDKEKIDSRYHTLVSWLTKKDDP